MDDLITWLRAQLDDDERGALVVPEPSRRWTYESYVDQRDGTVGLLDMGDRPGREAPQPGVGLDDLLTDAEAAHIARHDPGSVLREVEAKRLLLGDHTSPHTVVDGFCVEEGGPCTHAGEGYCQIDSWEGCRTQRLLALPFSDRPGYQESWRP